MRNSDEKEDTILLHYLKVSYINSKGSLLILDSLVDGLRPLYTRMVANHVRTIVKTHSYIAKTILT